MTIISEKPGALVILDPNTKMVQQTIRFQYNPETLKRSLQPQMQGGEPGNRSYAVRFTGAPVEKYDVQVHLDATDEDAMIPGPADGSGSPTKVIDPEGIYPELCTLELLAYPDTATIENNVNLLKAGTMEVAPPLAPQILFWWGNNRIAPVQIESVSVDEEFYDYNLSVVRATVSLSMRVLSYTDVAPDTAAYNAFMTYHKNKVNASEGKAPIQLDL
ncbi:MAG: hypothetical protein QNK37_19165 [Acidobacteriota bacterium]|nr:hypothetical protein [Acidobacteriota bacterium]